MPDAPAKPDTEAIYRVLRERICLLELEPGERLTEAGLADEFGVSRTPIRQVLDRLEFERLVDHQPGVGSTVSTLDTKALRDVWAVRLKIAELLGDFVRLPAAPEVIDHLRLLREDLDHVRTSRDLTTLGALYNRYHEAVLEVFSNEPLRRIYDQLYHQTARVWLQFLPEMDLDDEIEIMTSEIDDVTRAMRGTSGADLARIRARHMRMLLDRFNEHVSRPIP